MKRYQVKEYKVEEVDSGRNVSRCCETCGSDYLTQNEVRKEIASRLRQLGNQIEHSQNEIWSIAEIWANTRIMYSTLLEAKGESEE